MEFRGYKGVPITVLSLFNHDLRILYTTISSILSLTESPIEKYLLLALIVITNRDDRFYTVNHRIRTPKLVFYSLKVNSGWNEDYCTLLIEPQANIDGYRVDLLLDIYMGDTEEDRESFNMVIE